MADDLRNYQLQLQQVEAALLTDKDNEELLKLKTDLEEVIELTQDLIKSQEGEAQAAAGSALSDEEGEKQWKVGDKCMAKWKSDAQFYEAVIEEIIGTDVKVKFEGFTSLQPVSIADIKPVQGAKRPLDDDESKQGKTYSREYLKKKKQKKQQRFKQIEEERETDKNKWLTFHTKSAKKPGVRAKSIFASPDNLQGRVGIGTCGIAGKPMTEYVQGEKWKKGGG